MKNSKIMVIVSVIVGTLCAGSSISRFIGGETSSALLWAIAAICWIFCGINSYNQYKNGK